jgi:putative DNA primase/helicase
MSSRAFPLLADGTPDYQTLQDLANSDDGLEIIQGTGEPDAEIVTLHPTRYVNENEKVTRKPSNHAGCDVVTDRKSEPEATDATIIQLTKLTPIEYDRVRKEKADGMGIRTTVLDKAVASKRKESQTGGGIDFDDVDPWPEPVNPSALLTDITVTVKRFIVCQDETAHAVALWVAMTWLIDVVQVAPLAIITAPEKRCGKSMLLFLISRLAYRPLAASNITPSALFRSIDAWSPTLLVDEADAFMKDNEELRGILNCGHTRDSAYIIRTVGDTFTPTRFNVWGAKALAGIGHLADTLMDRAITLELRRKLPHEEVERLRYAEPNLFETLAAKLARFSNDYREEIRKARPELPHNLHDRAQDNWEPLLAIAGVAGGAWPELSVKAALKLSGNDSPSMTVGTELLSDIQEIFNEKQVDRISTTDLIKALCADDEKSWATYNRGKSISPRQVSSRMKDYGITSQTIRIGSTTVKGYTLDRFNEAFSRYLSPPPVTSVTPSQPSNHAGLAVTDSPTRYVNESEKVTRKASTGAGCDVVTDRKTEKDDIFLTEGDLLGETL